jgi:hypothetical protein
MRTCEVCLRRQGPRAEARYRIRAYIPRGWARRLFRLGPRAQEVCFVHKLDAEGAILMKTAPRACSDPPPPGMISSMRLDSWASDLPILGGRPRRSAHHQGGT